MKALLVALVAMGAPMAVCAWFLHWRNRREFERLFAPGNLESCEVRGSSALVSFKCGRRFRGALSDTGEGLWVDAETGNGLLGEMFWHKLDAIARDHKWTNQQP